MIPLRVALGLLAVFFAYYLGRSCIALCQGQQARSRTITWVLRTAVCLLAVFWGAGLDFLSGTVALLTALVCAAGACRQLHPPKEEGLVKKMFPKD